MTIRNQGNNPGIAPCGAVVFRKGCAVVVTAALVVVVLFAADDDDDDNDDEEGVFGTPHTRDSVPFMCVSPGLQIGFCYDVTWAQLNLTSPISNIALAANIATNAEIASGILAIDLVIFISDNNISIYIINFRLSMLIKNLR